MTGDRGEAHPFTRVQREARRFVESTFAGSAAYALPATEADQIEAVKEVERFVATAAGMQDELGPIFTNDPAALVDAEAESRAAAGDPTADVWRACAQSMRNRAATAELEDQFGEGS